MLYPVKVKKVQGSYVVSFDHSNGRFQGACEGATKEEALAEAKGLLIAMIASAIEDGEQVPMPDTCQRGTDRVSVTATLGMKIILHNLLITSGTTKAELARRMGKQPNWMQRIFDPYHESRTDSMEAVMEVMGGHFDLKLAA
jgi:antitoxin HicB